MNAVVAAPRRPSTNVRAARTRERIIKAARHLFSLHGFTATTVRDVAHEAGITDGAIYYHFSDKNELLRTLMESELEPSPAPSTPIDAAVQPLSSVLQTIASRALSLIGRNAPLFRIVLLEALAGDEEAVCRYQQLLADWECRLTNTLAPFERDGTLRTGESAAVARQVLSTLVFACEDALLLRPSPGESREQRWARLETFLRAAFARLASPASRAESIERRSARCV